MLPAVPDGLALKHPFWVFEWQDVVQPEVLVCSAVLFLSGVLCSAAGIGGGGIYVAVLMLIGKLSPHNAVPLSKAIVFFGAVASTAVNLRRLWAPAATVERAVINFDACRLVVPASLIGTFLGVLLNWHMPDHTIVVVLTMLLGFMTAMVLRTAWKQHLEEVERDAGHGEEEGAPLVPKGLVGEAAAGGAALRCRGSGSSCEARSSVGPPASMSKVDIAMAGVLLLLVVLSGILRFHLLACRAERAGQVGNAGACRHPFVATLFAGHFELWMSRPQVVPLLEHTVMTLPLWTCVFIALYYGRVTHVSSNWKAQSVVAYQAVALGTGMLAGLVGIGGGLIFSPFFLLMGMEPAVAVATSSTCVLFTSSSTTFQYLFTDRIIMSLALVYGTVTLLASYTGTSLVHLLEDQFRRKRSYISLIVASGVALSAVLSTVKFVKLMHAPGA